jgi:hypothetical protein
MLFLPGVRGSEYSRAVRGEPAASAIHCCMRLHRDILVSRKDNFSRLGRRLGGSAARTIVKDLLVLPTRIACDVWVVVSPPFLIRRRSDAVGDRRDSLIASPG